jgi:dienelactone hydrolase
MPFVSDRAVNVKGTGRLGPRRDRDRHLRYSRGMRAVWWMGWHLGCAAPGEPVPPPRVVPEGATMAWYAPDRELTTFPDAAQTVADAALPTGRRVRLSEGASASFSALLPEGFHLLEPLQAMDGFGLLAPVTLRFTAPVDRASVEAATRWLDLDAPGGAPVEVAFEATWGDDDATVFLTPLRPLRAGADHVVVVGGDARDASGSPIWSSPALYAQVWGASPERPDLDARWERALAALGASPDDVAHGAVFGTQSRSTVEERASAVLRGESPRLRALGGCAPDHGARGCPATLDVADLLGEDDVVEEGEAIAVQRRYVLPVSVWLPDPAVDGPGPWPVVVYAHGLGGGRWEGGGVADQLAGMGIAVVAVDAPRHHEHPTATTDADLLWVLQFFGIDETAFSLDAAKLRDAWRRAAWDKVQLVAALAAAPDLDGDGVADVVPDQIHLVGHSLGGIMGVHLLAEAPQVRSAMLSVPGGRVSSIVQDSPTFAPLVALMAPDDATPTDIARFFPVLQTVIDATDPAVHAARAVAEHDVWQDMVLGDDIIPNASNRALARAVAPEIAGEVLDPIAGLAGPLPFPVAGNVDGFTRVLTQTSQLWNGSSWDDIDHAGVFDHPAHAAQLRAWLSSALTQPHAALVAPPVPEAP